MTTALIAEDEPVLAQILRTELASLWPELHCLPTVGDGRSALEATLVQRPDVCFLDIRMPALSGLEVAQALAEDWVADKPLPLLVFVTAFDQYAVQAFDAQAADYLVKPVNTARLSACVTRLKARLATLQPGAVAPPAGLEQSLSQLRALLSAAAPPAGARLQVLQAQAGSVVHIVPVDEVIYFEAADKYVRVLTAEREYLVRIALRDLLPQLDATVFWQVHRATVVQARCVATARREETGKVTLTLKGRPETVTASRLYAHLFKSM